MLARLCSLVLLPVFFLSACADLPDGAADGNDEPEIAALTRAILDLGDGIDPDEAARAARISYEYTAELAVAYEITDPPLVHNSKVNLGIKPRGLCWHWATDLEDRLNEEGFETLTMHRAIANAFNPVLIAHSTAIISRAGDEWDEGIVLDPWRYGGVMFWGLVVEDDRYPWQARDEVMDIRRANQLPG